MDIFTVEFGNFRYMLWACIMQFHFSPWVVLSKSKRCCQSTIFAPFQLWDEGPQINQKQHFDWALFQSVDITTVVRGPVVKQSKQWRQCWSNDQSDSFYSVIRILLQKRTSCNVQGECDDNEDDENRRDEFCAPNPQPLFFPVALIWSGFSGKSLDRWETGFDCQLEQEVAFQGRLCRFTWFLSTIINTCDVVVNVKAGLMGCRGSMLLLLHLYAWEACFYLSGLFVCLLIVWTKRETDRRLLPPWCNRLVVKSRSKQRCCQSSQTDQAQMLHFSICLSFCLFCTVKASQPRKM